MTRCDYNKCVNEAIINIGFMDIGTLCNYHLDELIIILENVKEEELSNIESE